MTQPGQGTLLVATPVIDDPNFERSVILILRHDPDGTLGVVLDRPTGIPVGDYLPEWEPVVCEPAVVFSGGPVEPEIGIGLAIGPEGEVEMVDLELGPTDERPVRIFAGYAGWSQGQLAAELRQDAWFVLQSDPADLTAIAPDRLWNEVLRRQRSRLALFATLPEDPAVN